MSSQVADTPSRFQPPCEYYWHRFDQLDTLLRDAGFSTTPDRWQNTHDLLLKMLEADKLPEAPAQLRPLLAPLFCHSAWEQQQFTKLFDQWLRLIRPQTQQAEPDLLEQPQQQESTEPPPNKPRLPILMGFSLALVFTLLAGFLLTYDKPDVSVELQEQIPPPLPDETKATTPASIEDLKLLPIPPRRPLEVPSLDTKYRAYVGSGQWLLGLLPLLLGLTWLALLWRDWQTVLQRRRSQRQQADPLHAITLTAVTDELFDTRALCASLRRLHTPVAYPTTRPAAFIWMQRCSSLLATPGCCSRYMLIA